MEGRDWRVRYWFDWDAMVIFVEFGLGFVLGAGVARRASGDVSDSNGVVEEGFEFEFGLRLNANLDFGVVEVRSTPNIFSRVFNCYIPVGVTRTKKKKIHSVQEGAGRI
jgi:hypothetical protein